MVIEFLCEQGIGRRGEKFDTPWNTYARGLALMKLSQKYEMKRNAIICAVRYYRLAGCVHVTLAPCDSAAFKVWQRRRHRIPTIDA